MRIETDQLGEKTLPDVCYGLQTARAVENFPLGEEQVHPKLIQAIILVKQAAAMTLGKLQQLPQEKCTAIIEACGELLHDFSMEYFPTHPLQGGAGTSTNMNVNEVIANLALKKMGAQYGEYDKLHPLDDVNRFQSTNDVYPTALRIATIGLVRQLADCCAALQQTLQQKEHDFAGIQKLGRTELMDAVPITLGQEFGAYAQAIARDRWRIYKVEERLRQINLGGTAVGTGSNTTRKYGFLVVEQLRTLTDMGLSFAEYPMDLTQNQDVFVEVSGLLKALAVNLMKISSDLRWMNSGPYGGLGEIRLQPLQQGSTIMPGKINPVIPESVTQVAIQVMASDTAITTAAACGNFELNAFLPLIAEHLLKSLTLLVKAVPMLQQCVETLIPQESRCQAHLDASMAVATALTVDLGYQTVSALLAKAQGDKQALIQLVKPLLSEERYQTVFEAQ